LLTYEYVDGVVLQLIVCCWISCSNTVASLSVTWSG
jgi:hypothetical protein